MDKINKAPLVSIVTVVLNDLEGLKLTNASIEAQAFRKFEWIIIDGGSTDGTPLLLNELNQDTATWISEKDSGIYEAMNKGLKLSVGQYVVFMNAGDTFAGPTVLQKVHDHLKAEEADILFGGAMLVLPKGKQIYRPPRKMQEYIWHGLPANHQATYFRREVVINMKYDTKYQICSDYYLVARLFKQGVKATYLDVPLVNFYVGGSSYRNLVSLFLDPYAIQRDVLDLPLSVRLRSLFKRFISTAAMRFLSSVSR